jgi:hypothetical protein
LGISKNFQAYAVVTCSSNLINLRNGFLPFASKDEGLKVPREKIAIVVVLFDLFLMICLLFTVWFLIYFVRVDAERHRNLLFET